MLLLLATAQASQGKPARCTSCGEWDLVLDNHYRGTFQHGKFYKVDNCKKCRETYATPCTKRGCDSEFYPHPWYAKPQCGVCSLKAQHISNIEKTFSEYKRTTHSKNWSRTIVDTKKWIREMSYLSKEYENGEANEKNYAEYVGALQKQLTNKDLFNKIRGKFFDTKRREVMKNEILETRNRIREATRRM